MKARRVRARMRVRVRARSPEARAHEGKEGWARMRVRVRARSPEARAHEGEEGWGEGFVASEPHTETITLSLDYGVALSPPGPL